MGLRLGLASGKLPLAVEAEVLVDQSGDEPCSAVDVLVATPGRLMSHLQGTPGMHLNSLKILVSAPNNVSIHAQADDDMYSSIQSLCMLARKRDYKYVSLKLVSDDIIFSSSVACCIFLVLCV